MEHVTSNQRSPIEREGAVADSNRGGPTVLCVGDMHLGRRPTHLPGWLDVELEGGRDSLGPAAAFEVVVDEAVRRRVDLVLFAGDLVDSSNRFFEAYGRLHAGVSRLDAAGIAVAGVAGNHDVEVLPRLASELAGFHLIGAGGAWATWLLPNRDLRILGWSFREAKVTTSPMLELPPEYAVGRFDDGAPAGTPTLGVLHCDLGATGGPYAPVRRIEFDQEAVSAWALGHVHAPSELSGTRPVGYLGSIVGLHPGELGRRGPWLTEWERGRATFTQLQLAPLRWEEVVFDVDGIDSTEDLEDGLVRAIRAHAQLPEFESEHLRAVGVRLTMRGPSSIPRVERERIARQASAEWRTILDGVWWFLDRVVDEAVAPVALDDLARDDDPVGLLARRLIRLQKSEARDDIEAARPLLERRVAHKNFDGLEPLDFSDEAVREVLIEAARRSLDALLAQRDDSLLHPAPPPLANEPAADSEVTA